VKFGHVVFDICERTDRQTDKQTERSTLHPYRGEVTKCTTNTTAEEVIAQDRMKSVNITSKATIVVFNSLSKTLKSVGCVQSCSKHFRAHGIEINVKTNVTESIKFAYRAAPHGRPIEPQ